MKIRLQPRRDGSAVIVVLALLAILFVFVSYNVITLRGLGREVKAMEQRQVERLKAST